MPLLKLSLPFPLDNNTKESTLKALSDILAKELNKPEKYVMVTIDQASIAMAGSSVPAAFCDVRSIGALSEPVNKKFTTALCEYLLKTFQIKPDRVYVNFTDVKPENWGWSGRTFA
jgi:phenylpyruvate tautomerase